MIAATHVGVLGKLVIELKRQAMVAGRYPREWQSAFGYGVRDGLRRKEGLRAFRCVAYNELVRQIGALESVDVPRHGEAVEK